MIRKGEYNAVFLSVLMVVSMVAMGAVGAAGASSAGDDVSAAPGVDRAAVDAGADTAVQTQQLNDVDVADELATESGETTVIVRLEDPDLEGLSAETAERTLRSHAEATQAPVVEWAGATDGITVENGLWITNAVVATVDLDRVDTAELSDRLAQFPQVDRIHPDYEFSLPEPTRDRDADSVGPADSHVTYGLDQVNVPDAWDVTKGEGAEIAILDTGVDGDHPDIDIDPDNFVEIDSSGDPVNVDPYDSDDHGTHVSGTATGSDDPAGEVPAFGVAPDAELYHGLVIPSGGGSFTRVAGGIQWAADEGLDAASLSLGAGGYDNTVIPAVENAREMGTYVISSSGNNGAGTSGNPGNYWSTMSVGASDPNADIAGFSSGEEIDASSAYPDAPEYWPDEYVVPQVSAPGVNVLSSVPGGGYDNTFSGTSMAAPHVAGTYALMVSAHGENNPELFEQVLEEYAWKPDDWEGPDDERDIRYGMGIIDTAAAVEEVQVASPQHEMGDVNEDGEITVQDVILVQQHVAEMPADINEELADMNRDGEIGVQDLITLQQRVVGMLEGSDATIDDVEVDTDEVELGETFTANVTITNEGDVGTIQYLNATFDGVDERSGFSVVDLAPGKTDEYTITVTADAGAAYDALFELSTDDDAVTETIDVLGDTFEITQLDAPGAVDHAGGFEADVTVENTGNQEATQDVAFTFAGDVEHTEPVTLQPGETYQKTVAVEVGNLDGEYDFGVETDDDAETGTVTVNAARFEVAIDDAEPAVRGDTANVTVTVENTGDGAGEQTIEHSVQQTYTVGIVDDPDSRFHEPWLDVFETWLDDDFFDFEVLTTDRIPEDMDRYDGFVVQRFDEIQNGDEGIAQDFLDNRPDHKPVLYLDSWGGNNNPNRAESVEWLHELRDDPGEYDDDLDSFDPTYLHIEQDHTIFDGVGTEGDFVQVKDNGYHAYWGNYSGTDLAQVSDDASSVKGAGASIDEERNEALLTLGYGNDDHHGDNSSTILDSGYRIIANTVSYLHGFGSEAVVGPEETTVGAEDGIGERTLSIDAGNETTIDLEYETDADLDLTSGWEHFVSSDDDSDSEPLVVDYDTGTVEGTVVDDVHGDPVADVAVELEAADGLHETTTNETGEFVFENVPEDPDPVTSPLTFSKDGFEDATREVAVPGNDTETVELVLVQEPASIGGSVVASDNGEPIEGALINAVNMIGEEFTAQSGTDGGYTIDDLRSGQYQIEVEDANDFYPESAVDLAPGEDIENVNFELDPMEGTLEGTVTDVNDEPLEGATVTDANGPLEVQTNDSGYFHVDDIERGLYALEVTHPDEGEGGPYFVEVESNEVASVEMTAGTFFEASDFEGDTETRGYIGTRYLIGSANVTNLGDHLAEWDVTYFYTKSDGACAIDGDATVENIATKTVELEGGESTSVEFDESIGASPEPGEWEHCITAHNTVGETITVPGIHVGDFESTPADSVEPGETVNVSATVTNHDSGTVTDEIEYQFDGDAVDSEEVTLDPGENTTVEFSYEVPDERDAGEFEHGVHSPDYSDGDTITVETVLYDATINLDGADQALAVGETVNYTVTAHYNNGTSIDVTDEANVDNANATVAAVDEPAAEVVGQSEGTTSLTPTFDGVTGDAFALTVVEDVAVDVAVVDADVNYHGDDIESMLADRLPANFETSVIGEDDDPVAEVDNHDVFVVQRLGHEDEATDIAADFVDNLTADQGVVWLDTYTSSSSTEESAHGVEMLAAVSENLSGYDSDSYLGSGDTSYHITQDHELFAGVDDDDGVVTLHDDFSTQGAFFSNYTAGDTLAEVGTDEDPEEPSVAVSDDEREVVLGTSGWYDGVENDWYDDAHRIVTNGVGIAADLGPMYDDSAGSTSDSADGDRERIGAVPAL